MKKRIIVIDFSDCEWFGKTVELANKLIETPFEPDEEALEMFDQRLSFEKLCNQIF